MGCVKGITANEFPNQSNRVGCRVDVCFHYNTEATVGGVIVRDDLDEPFLSIIRLDDERFVLGTECQCREKLDEVDLEVKEIFDRWGAASGSKGGESHE